MLSLQLQIDTVPADAPRQVAEFSFPECRCGSRFRCLTRRGWHYVELAPEHTCRHCRLRIIRHAIACRYLVVDEA